MYRLHANSASRWVLLLLLFALVLAGCREEATPEPTPPPPTSPPATSTATPLPEPTAAPASAPAPVVRLETDVIAVGETVALAAESFPAGAVLELRLSQAGVPLGQEPLGGAMAGADGSASLDLALPAALPDGTALLAGDYELILATADGEASASVPFTLVIPETGAAAAEAAQAALTRDAGVDLAAIVVIAVEPAEWSDSCLGLGGPAESCLMAITPGYQITLEASGQTYVYRTDQDGSQVRLESPAGTSEPPPPAELARQQLAVALGLLPDVLEVASALPRDWGDACLGLGAPDQLCAAVITPGYEIVLDVDGRQITYRTDLNGHVVLLAGASAPAADDVVLAWERVGGIAGFCDALRVTAAGQASAGRCDGAPAPLVADLAPEQQAPLDDWLRTFRAFAVVTSDGAVADSLTISLHFLGTGEQTPTTAQAEEIAAFASEVHFAQSQPQAGPAPESPPTGATWQRFLVPLLDMSFPVRATWTRQGDEPVWQTEQGGLVSFAAAGVVADLATLLPAGSQVVRSSAADQGWASGTFYRLTRVGPDGATRYGASYALRDDDDQAFLFSAEASDPDTLATLEADLARMVGAVAFAQGAEDKVSGPTQVLIDFLAAWLNDEAGLEDYLSQRLRDALAAGTDLATAFGLPGDNYRSFTVAWIQTGGGRSQVRATFVYDGGPQSRVFNLVQENNAWVVDGAE